MNHKANDSSLDRIRGNFSRAAAQYDDAARIQAVAAERLARDFLLFLGRDYRFSRIAEFGCGTGFLTARLAGLFPGAEITAYDLSPAMLRIAERRMADRCHASHRGSAGNAAGGEANTAAERARENPPQIMFIQADAERLELTQNVDCIASNFCVQWFNDPLASLAFHLRQTHFLAWTMLLEGTFASWQNLHDELGLPSRLRGFPTQEQLERRIAHLAPQRFAVSVRNEEFSHSDAREFVRALRTIGAHAPHPRHEASALRRILRRAPQPFITQYRIATVFIER